MHLSVDSTKPLDALRADLMRACADNGLVVARSSDATERLRERNIQGARGTFVLEIEGALPELAASAPGGPDASTYRIAGFEKPDGGTRLSTIRPSHLMELLGHPELAGGALRFEHTLEAVLRAAAE